jgi:hypothetical protein
MQRSSSPGSEKPLTAHGHVTLQLQFSKYVPERRQLTAPLSGATGRGINPASTVGGDGLEPPTPWV